MLLVGVAALATLAALTLGFNVLLRSNLQTDANRVLEARTAAALEALQVKRGALHVHESPDSLAPDQQVWVYRGTQALERPPSPRSVQRLADSMAAEPPGFAESTAFDTRLYAVPVTSGNRRIGTVVAALGLDPYERSASKALVGSILFAFAAFMLVLIVTTLVVNRALRPVARMTAEATDWSEHDLDHRFNEGPPRDELTALAATFDGMLERLASSIRHEQRLSAELSHELRTPLAAIVTTAELALRREREDDEYREALRDIEDRASRMQRTLDTVMAAARAESSQDSGVSDAAEVGRHALETCRALAQKRGIDLRLVAPPAPLSLDVNVNTAERLLAPLIENGCRYGRSEVALRIQQSNGSAEFLITDDGPGVIDADRTRLFEPGFRGKAGLDAEAGGGAGAGLGLSLARRLGRAVGGEVDLVENGAGAGFRVRIPLAHQPH